ncbi:MAG TPA: DUF4388 domain-containing protein [Thermoanaerobaculia bacterium]
MKLEGEIGEISLIERLVELGREQFTGAIRFENDGIIKIIYFKTGDVLSASTNDRADSIDEILMRANKVSREHVKQALAKRKETETLGDALLGLGFITKKELTWARRVQVIGVIRSIAAWTAGSFTVVADYLPKREEGTLFPLPQIITELIVTDTDRAKFDTALEGGSTILMKVADFDDQFRRLGLNQEAAAIAANIDGVNSASEIAMLSGTDTFNVYKLLHALHVLGLLATTQKPEVKPQEWSMPASSSDFQFETEAVSDAADMWDEPAMPTTEIPAPTPIPSPELEASYESFDDNAPSLDLPAMSAASFDTAPESEPEPPEMAGPPVGSAMPTWDRTAAPPPITPMQSFEKPRKAAEPEPQWGFDEAQLETARRAADSTGTGRKKDPPPMKAVVAKASKPGKWVDTLIIAVAIVVIGFGGYAFWWWWQNKQADQAAADNLVVRRPVKHAVIHPTPPPPTPAPAPLPVATTTTTATPTPVPQPAKPMVIAATTTPPPATSTAPRLEHTSTGGMVITNSGAAKPVAAAVPPASDADRARYETMAKQFAADKSGNFTLQFELVCEPASITRALREGGNNVWFLPINYRNRSCYRVFWGRYPTQESAQSAIAGIPQTLREAAPVVVHIPK